MSSTNVAAISLPSPDGTTLSFAEITGRRTILLLANQKTGKAARVIADRVHADPSMAAIPIVQVAHLVGVPRLVRKLAEREVRGGLQAQRQQLRARLAATGRPDDSAALLRLGLDWEGRVTTPLGFSAANEAPLLAVIDEQGTVRVVDSGDGIDRLRELLTSQVEFAHEES
ncbi:MAG: hypothetical protein ABJD68_00040 [Nakamurella sp.]